MSELERIEARRLQRLIQSIRDLAEIFPGDKIRMIGESPATYLGSIEAGDLQTDYLQLHVFRLSDGIMVIMYIPTLNRSLGKYIF